jgi:hypothetical protein
MLPPLVVTVDGKQSVSWHGICLTGLVVSALSVLGFLGVRFALDVILGSTVSLFPGILLAATFTTVLVLGTQLRTQLRTASLVPHDAGRRSISNATRLGVIAVLGTFGMTLLGLVLWQATGDDKPTSIELAKIQPPGGVPLSIVKPGTTEIGVDQLNMVTACTAVAAMAQPKKLGLQAN